MLVSIISTIVFITVISSITKCYYASDGHNCLCNLVIILVLFPHHTFIQNFNLSDIYMKVVGVIKIYPLVV